MYHWHIIFKPNTNMIVYSQTTILFEFYKGILLIVVQWRNTRACSKHKSRDVLINHVVVIAYTRFAYRSRLLKHSFHQHIANKQHVSCRLITVIKNENSLFQFIKLIINNILCSRSIINHFDLFSIIFDYRDNKRSNIVISLENESESFSSWRIEKSQLRLTYHVD